MKAYIFIVIGYGDDADEAWLNLIENRVEPEVKRAPDLDIHCEDDDDTDDK